MIYKVPWVNFIVVIVFSLAFVMAKFHKEPPARLPIALIVFWTVVCSIPACIIMVVMVRWCAG